MSKTIFGIIGGAGVKASNELMKRIENTVTDMGAYRDFHHPEIILWQATSSPSRSMYLEGKGPSFIEDYISIAKNLKSSGASYIFMCCNTAHYAIEQIKKEVKIKVINLLEETVKTLKKDFLDYKNVGLLCSDGTKKHKLYDKYFNKIYSGVNIIYPEDDFQKFVTDGICKVKDRNDMTPANVSFHKAINHLKDKGANMIVIVCTDISLALGNKDFDIPYLDTTDVLKNTLLKIWQEKEKLKFKRKI
ncbi:aspartate/glutamate racemase family protein [Pseudomonadota bacterium]